MATKYVLEIGHSGFYLGWEIESRTLYPTYEEAKAEYDRILKEKYSEEELSVDEDGYCELREEHEGCCNGDVGYIDDWSDDEKDLFLAIYKVEEIC